MQRIKSWSIQATTREAKLDDRRLEKCCLDFCLNRKVGSEFNVNSMRLKCLLTSNDAPLKEQTEVFFLLTMRYSFICLLSIQLFLNNATIKLIRQKAITWKYDCWENNKKNIDRKQIFVLCNISSHVLLCLYSTVKLISDKWSVVLFTALYFNHDLATKASCKSS